MLPGFRFLFGAIVLCFSILVFGLGAAALFRAAHEEFASRPSWRATPGTMLAQQNEPFAQQSDPSRAVLALLEVEPDEAVRETSRDSAQEPGLQPSESEATVAVMEPSTGNPVDAPKLSVPEPLPVAATAKDAAAMPEPETMAQLEPGMSPGNGSAAVEHVATPATASDAVTPVASLNETAFKITEPKTIEPKTAEPRTADPAPAVSEPTTVPAASPQPTAPGPRIAALESPETTDAQAREKEASSEARAKAYRNFIRNRLRAQRAAKARRRLAHRARIVRRAAIQQQQQRPAFTTVPATPPFPTVPATTTFPTTESPYRF
jgi:hypothetical protein